MATYWIEWRRSAVFCHVSCKKITHWNEQHQILQILSFVTQEKQHKKTSLRNWKDFLDRLTMLSFSGSNEAQTANGVGAGAGGGVAVDSCALRLKYSTTKRPSEPNELATALKQILPVTWIHCFSTFLFTIIRSPSPPPKKKKKKEKEIEIQTAGNTGRELFAECHVKVGFRSRDMLCVWVHTSVVSDRLPNGSFVKLRTQRGHQRRSSWTVPSDRRVQSLWLRKYASSSRAQAHPVQVHSPNVDAKVSHDGSMQQNLSKMAAIKRTSKIFGHVSRCHEPETTFMSIVGDFVTLSL